MKRAERRRGILTAVSFTVLTVSAACHGQTAEEVDSTSAVAVKAVPATRGTIRAAVHATGIVNPAAGAELVSGARSPVHLSLLDFYYSPSRRAEWQEDYLPTDEVLELLTDRYGEPEIQDRFGCRFYWYDANGFSVRLKDSHSATRSSIGTPARR